MYAIYGKIYHQYTPNAYIKAYIAYMDPMGRGLCCPIYILGSVIREVGDPKKPSSIKRNDRVFLNTARILIDGDFLGGSNPQMGTMGIYIYIYIYILRTIRIDYIWE